MSDYDVIRSVGTMRRTAAGEIERWDGREWQPVPNSCTCTSCRPARREDLARDVGVMWTAAALNWGPPVSTVREVYPDLSAALDRLAAAYGTRQEG